ncbi:MAG: hypothetical protein GXP58_00850, partial [Deltaproteobacteria bacterium]|nr:hypothetical protein [Deltaproteobacteria bacterium]
IIANDKATERYKQHVADGREWLGRFPILLMVGEYAEENHNLQVVIEDSFPQESGFTLQDSKLGVSYDVFVTCRRLGEDTGRDVFMDYGNLLITVKEHIKKTLMESSKSEL